MIAGYLFACVLPERKVDSVFNRLVTNRRARRDSRPGGLDPIRTRMKVLLEGHYSDQAIREFAECYYQIRAEDSWGRWQASRKSEWSVRTEVTGLEQVKAALQQDSGIIFWGMSFCGTLFSKVALSRAAIALTQLSSADHGANYPLSLLGKWFVGPLYCLPEGRYLCERIRIPVDEGSSYLHRIGEVLQNNGCVWIAGERQRAKKPVTVNLLSRSAQFPVGAPLLALRHKAVLLPTHTERLGRFHYRVTVEPPISLEGGIGRKELMIQAVQNYANRLANRILKNPSNWDWDNSWTKRFLASGSIGSGRIN